VVTQLQGGELVLELFIMKNKVRPDKLKLNQAVNKLKINSRKVRIIKKITHCQTPAKTNTFQDIYSAQNIIVSF